MVFGLSPPDYLIPCVRLSADEVMYCIAPAPALLIGQIRGRGRGGGGRVRGGVEGRGARVRVGGRGRGG